MSMQNIVFQCESYVFQNPESRGFRDSGAISHGGMAWYSMFKSHKMDQAACRTQSFAESASNLLSDEEAELFFMTSRRQRVYIASQRNRTTSKVVCLLDDRHPLAV